MGMAALAAGLVIKAKDKITPVLGKIGRGFGTLQKQGAALKRGLGMMGQGVSQLANRVGLGLGIAMGVGAHKAAAFEEQVSVVKSVLQTSAAETDPLILKMKQLGATTVFSATQAAQGAEFLSRAGFDAREQLAALEGTLNAAAAEAIPLGTAANIVANNVRAFGLDAAEASHVADVLALTAAKTNTNMIELGEAMKYAAPEAKALNISVDETAQMLGLLANAGLQGTIGGTAFKNMLIKLGRPSDAVKARLNKLGIQFQNTHGDMLPITTVVKNIAKGTEKLQGNLAKTAFLTEFLGIRGKAAAQVLNQMTKAGKDGKVPIDALAEAFEDVTGSAEKMAKIRLDNFRGSMTLLGSAIEGLSIELFTSSLGTSKAMVDGLAAAISTVVIGLQETDKILAGGTTPELEKLREKLGPIAETMLQIAFGIREGMAVLSQLMEKAKQVGMALGMALGENGEGAKGIAKWLTILSPFIVGFTALAGVAMLFIAPLMLIGSGLVVIAKGAAIFLAVVGAAFFGLWAFLNATKKEGQSLKDRFLEVFTTVRVAVSDFVAGFMGNFAPLEGMFDPIKEAGAMFLSEFQPLFDLLGAYFSDTSGKAMDFGLFAGRAFKFVITVVSGLIKIFSAVIGFFVDHFATPLMNGVLQITGGFRDLITGATSFKDAFVRVLKGLGGMIVSTLLKPLGMVSDVFIEVGRAAGLNMDGAGIKGLEKIRDTIQGREGTFFAMEDEGPNKRVQKALAEKAKSEKNAADSAQVEANKAEKTVNLQQGDTKHEITTKTDVCVDGKALNVASSNAKVDLADRTGGVINPQRAGQISFNGDIPQNTR